MILPTQERKIEIESETIGWIGHKERKVDETSSLMSTRDEKREREREIGSSSTCGGLMDFLLQFYYIIEYYYKR